MGNCLQVYVKAHQKLFPYLTVEISSKKDVYICLNDIAYNTHLSRHQSGSYNVKTFNRTTPLDKRVPIGQFKGLEWLGTYSFKPGSFIVDLEGQKIYDEPQVEPSFIVDADRLVNVQLTLAILTESGVSTFEAWANNFRETSYHVFREFTPFIGVVAVRPQTVIDRKFSYERLKNVQS